MIPCFFLEETGRERLSLRRYNGKLPCPGSASGMSYHNAHAPFGERDVVRTSEGRISANREDIEPPHTDPLWPTHCACGYEFTESDNWQVFGVTLYTRADTWEIVTLREAPVGALWYADWLLPHHVGPDGHCLMCKTPGGDWLIDGRASNCGLPQDSVHRCWVRHGDPTDPLGLKTGQPLHVDKNGHTCNAGAGSIGFPTYHGFLHNGHLTLA